MWQMIRLFTWAQVRIVRNRLSRVTAAVWGIRILIFLWYGAFAAGGAGLAYLASVASRVQLQQALPLALLLLFALWQWLPLLMVNAGWSLQLNKLRAYPVPDRVFFVVEIALRITTSLEMAILASEVMCGLLCNRAVPKLGALTLLLYILLNLLITWVLRDLILNSFAKSRFREIVLIIVLSSTLVPQLLINTEIGSAFWPHVRDLAQAHWTPWNAWANLVLGHLTPASLLLPVASLLAAYALARWVFARSMRTEESFATGPSKTGKISLWSVLPSVPGRDPMAALIAREFRALLRMPRFRVIFGMATLFSILIFFTLSIGIAGTPFVRENVLTFGALYGLLILGDTLFWNIFGFDGPATQLYFASPMSLRTVFVAKNLVAAAFIAGQAAVVLALASALRTVASGFQILTALLALLTVGVFFVGIGNMSSVAIPRRIDPTQTMRKQATGSVQLWTLGCMLGAVLLVGLGFLARWAFQSEPAMCLVLLVELGAGIVFYRIALDSAVSRGMANRESIITALAKDTSPVAS